MLTRREVLRVAALLDVGSAVGACASSGVQDDARASAVGDRAIADAASVVVIGAGAAGMSTAYFLGRAGVDVTVLEASSTHGGRIKTSTDFVDFSDSAWAEWIHVNKRILESIVDDDSVTVETEVSTYGEEHEAWTWDGATLTNDGLSYDPDLKFVGDTWLTFYEQYIVPAIENRIVADSRVTNVAQTDAGVAVVDASGGRWEADAVVVSVPIQVMKDRDISFDPPLPADKVAAFDEAFVWGGMKVFIEFAEKFWPSSLLIDGAYSRDGQKLWYDASQGQRSDRHVLGLFSVGDQAQPYQQQTEESLLPFVLSELDAIFDGIASDTYVQHISQNWNAEPYIRQAYFADLGDWRLPPRMREPVDGRIFFAGDAYTDGEDWSSVHTAAQSARDAFDAMTAAGVI